MDSSRQLKLLKNAMRQASQEVKRNSADRLAQSLSGRLDCTLTFLRSAERGHVVGQIRCASLYSHLSTLVDVIDPFLSLSCNLDRVREHAMILSSSDLAQRIRDLSVLRGQVSEQAYRNRKDQIAVRLRRLLPGSTSDLNAIEGPVSKQVAFEPSETYGAQMFRAFDSLDVCLMCYLRIKKQNVFDVAINLETTFIRHIHELCFFLF